MSSASRRACSFSVSDACSAETSVVRRRRLELAEADEVGLELLDLVGEVGALAPDVLEARDDLVEQPVGRVAAVAAEQRLRRPHVSDLYRCECHGLLPLVEVVEDPDDEPVDDGRAR